MSSSHAHSHAINILLERVPADMAIAITRAAAKALQDRFGLHHSTIQVEKLPCELADGEHRF